MLEIILISLVLVLLIVVIVILFIRTSNKDSSNSEKLSIEQNIKFDNLNNNIQALSQNNLNQLQNMNQQLNNVYQSLGEMKSISSDVESLRRVLANVKSRGSFAEVQLERILEQVIPGMYEKNVKPNPRSNKIVEFALKIPNGKEGITWLPIDSKFPLDRYEKLVEASQDNNAQNVEICRKMLINEIDKQATKIKDSYIFVPYTTNFAVMYLATEGMYMEAVTDKDGLLQKLQDRGIMVAGPSTIIALLNSLAMGFNMIKINENADEIRKSLGDIKRQFNEFYNNFEVIEDGIQKANGALDNAKRRSDLIIKSLDRIEIKD